MSSKVITRRSFLRKTFGTLVTFLGLSGGGYYYVRYFEPDWVETNHVKISSNKIPKSFDQYKILQFSDTHLGFNYQIQEFESLINKMNELHADLVLFTGDLIDAPDRYQQFDKVGPLLKKIQSKDGKYWIYGNHDHGGYGTEILKDVMTAGEFTLLQNEHQQIKKNRDFIFLSGLDDGMLGKPDLNLALQGVNPETYTILMMHEPDFADLYTHSSIDLMLSGHSHGGQVQLPYLGHLIAPPYGQKYVNGSYSVGESDFHLYVNKGIGTTRLPYRFLCRPEITLFTLNSSV
ncbi:metallophosphoesterase [Bacillaceae bacterium S4-13-56]